jgi:Xaa-Pro aminopeptidase
MSRTGEVTRETMGRRALIRNDFTAEEFAERRAKLLARLEGGRALVAGATMAPTVGAFRQFNDFYYLCGIEVPFAYLLMDAEAGQSTIYLPPHSDRRERIDGPSLSAADADLIAQLTGAEFVKETGSLLDDLSGSRRLYTPHDPAEGYMASLDALQANQKRIDDDPLNKRPSEETHRNAFLNELLDQVPHDLSPILQSLRRIKSPAELDLLRRAGKICAEATNRAIRCTKPGLFEYQLAAVGEYIYRVNGARGAGYNPIVASGKNIWHPHYWRNNQMLNDGDLILFDCAPDLNYYTSDIGRMWPVNGKYDQTQRRLYAFIVEYHKVLLDEIRPGRTTKDIHDTSADRMRPYVNAMEFADDEEELGVRNTLTFHKHLTHGVGMSCHDHTYWGEGPLEPGAVIALDPQLWIPEKHIYIRVEDTVAVTPDGVENFTESAALELDDIEQMVGTSELF